MGPEVFSKRMLPGLKSFHFGKLRALDLSYNNLSSNCLARLIAALPDIKKSKGMRELEVINLSGNNFEDMLGI